MRQHIPRYMIAAATFALSVAPTKATAVTLFQPDTFDANPEFWSGGIQTRQVADGGPQGNGDGFLRIVSAGGAGNGSRFVAFNGFQWSGDFLGAGVEAIRLDAINLGNAALQLRLAFGDNGAPLNGGNWFASTVAQVLDPGSGWTTLTFPVNDSDYTLVTGGGAFDDVLGGVVNLRILSSATPSAFGDVLVATGGFDNIVAIPEPSAASLVGFAAAAVLFSARRKRRTG